jgi:phage shock protein A
MQDVAEAEQTIKTIIANSREIEEDLKDAVLQKEDAMREIDGLLENIEALKLKIAKERKEKKALEVEIKGLERQIYKELKSVKKHIVGEIENAAQSTQKGNRIIHSSSYDDGRRSPRVEVIL